jgi:outer membrane protein W
LAGADYTTSALIFLNPNSSDIVIRNQAFELTDLFSPVIDFRYSLNGDIILGLSSEYISHSAKGLNQTIIEGSQVRRIEVEDGVVFIPIELSIYYLMPFSSEEFLFTMGGGFGYYFAEHTRILGTTEIVNTDKNNSIGLLVSVGMEYLIIDNLGIRLDLKFRDPENKINYQYKDSTASYRGRELQIPQNTYKSKLNLNGISFIFGLAFHF